MKERTNTIYFPVFGYKVHIVVTDDILKSRNKRKAAFGDLLEQKDVKHSGGIFSFNIDKPESYIFLLPTVNVEVISHEVLHCVHQLMIWIEAGMEEEVYAYHIGYISQKCFDLVNKKERK